MCYKFGPRCPKSARSALRSAQKAVKSAVTEAQKAQANDKLAAATFEYYCTTEGLAFLESKIESDPANADYYASTLEQARASREYRIALANNQEEAHEEVQTAKDKGQAPLSHTERRALGLDIALNKEEGKPSGLYIDSIASLEELNAAYQAKQIEVGVHPDPNVPYVVLDYSKETQYKQDWNSITVNARGLMVNKETGEIVARPFRKFFNYDQPVPGLTDFDRSGPVVVTNKEDGSMGTLYTLPDGTQAISTRGSMDSEQARRATKMFNERYAGTWDQDPNKTYIFEIIYPENRIVLDYGDQEDLILVGAVNKATGRTYPLNEVTEWKGQRAEQYAYKSYAEALANPIADDKEGVVVHFTDNDERVKIKGERYKELHRKVSNLTTRNMWAHAMEGNDEEFIMGLPDEFYEPASQYLADIKAKHKETYDKAVTDAHAAAASVGFNITSTHNLNPDERRTLSQSLSKAYPGRKFHQHLAVLNGSFTKLSTAIWRDLKPDASSIINFNK